MDKILLKGLEVYAYHGVNREEKENGQRFLLDLTLYADLREASKSDSLSDTVNYAAVRKTAAKALTAHSFDLLERAAGEVAAQVLDAFSRVCKVRVRLMKPDAPMCAVFEYAGVEIERER